MTRLVIGPFNRVEGDLEVRLDVQDGLVRRAEVVSPLYRGFETILAGKTPSDALVFVPRICGICSVSQSVASARAIAAAQGLTPPPNGDLVTNIIHAVENVADHLTHFYLFFMPDFTREAYAARAWHGDVTDRFAAVKGSATADMLPARAAFLNMLGILAGKWPHTLGIRPGGSTRTVSESERSRLSAMLLAFRRFLERHLFGGPLEQIAALDSASGLEEWRAGRGPSRSDFGLWLAVSADVGLGSVGRAFDRFLSVGAYGSAAGPLFRAGVHDAGLHAFDPARITEDTAHSWYEPDTAARAPFDGRTRPRLGDSGYSWCKAPRYDGKPVEVGALARQVVDGHPLALDMIRTGGASVHARVVARLIEIARTMIALEGWVGDLDPQARFAVPDRDPREGVGIGLVEAARGALGHWLKVRDGRIENYQIVAPTTWNFSPRDGRDVPGPLEQALQGLPVAGPDSVLVQHVVRSFDPCMVCTVH